MTQGSAAVIDLVAAGGADRRWAWSRSCGTGRFCSQTVLPVAMSRARSLRAAALARPWSSGTRSRFVEDRQRGGVAVGVLGNAQAPRPGQLAVEVEGGHVAVGEDGRTPPAVGGRASARRSPCRRSRFTGLAAVRRSPGTFPLPQQLAAGRRRSNRPAAVFVGPGEEHALPQTTGELLPGSGTGVFQRMFLPVGPSQVSGTLLRARCPSRRDRGNAARPGDLGFRGRREQSYFHRDLGSSGWRG